MANLHSFKVIPTRKPPRSRFDLGKEALITCNEGGLVPFYCEEVLPFDTWEIDLGFSCRNLQTQVHPVMDDAYLDFYWFFVPSRLLWKHWEQFMGVAEPSAFTNPTEYVLPSLGTAWNGLVVKGSVANYLGLPPGLQGGSFGAQINLLPFAAYGKIWNDWFRDENLQNSNPIPELIYNLPSGGSLSADAAAFQYLNALFATKAGVNDITAVNKYKDLFTAALPAPAKGPEVNIISGLAQVVGYNENGSPVLHDTGNMVFGTGNASSPTYFRGQLFTTSQGIGSVVPKDASQEPAAGVTYLGNSNLVVDLGTAASNTIDGLRRAIAMNNYFINLARGGSRYIELLRTEFGVAPTDETLQRPELVGYQHERLQQHQVATTAGQGTVGTDSPTDTGKLGGYSVTSKYQKQTFKSFKEYGFMFGLAAIRVKHKYWQGIPRKFMKKSRFDFFIPDFDRLGAVPLPSSELYALGYDFTSTHGFQDSYYEYRYTPDTVAGDVVPDGTALDLGAWSYADTYAQRPTLSSSFIKEQKTNVAQTLAGTPGIDQYLLSIYADVKVTRPMSLSGDPSRLGM